MITIHKTINNKLKTIDSYQPGSWIHLESPGFDESKIIANQFGIDIGDLRAALDEEESSRLELEEGYTLIIVDIPYEEGENKVDYSTIPLGIILCEDTVITICKEDTKVIRLFTNNHIKGFSTKKKIRFVYQLMLFSSSIYQMYLRFIDKRRSEIENRANQNLTDDDLINLHNLESYLVYFTTSLSTNLNVLNRLTRYERIQQFPEDLELLEDAIIEHKQAIEMSNIYRDIIHGTRDLLTTIINNRLNNIMKILTSITLVMAIPTIISGFYGMNVDGKWMPLSSTPHGFLIITILTVIACAITMYILKKKKML